MSPLRRLADRLAERRVADVASRGYAAYNDGDYATAATAFREAAAVRGDSAIHLALARSLRNLGDHEGAHAAAEDAVAADPDHVAARLVAAEAASRVARPEGVRSALAGLRELDELSDDQLVQTARFAHRAELPSLASRFAGALLERDPTHPVALELQLRSLVATGQPEAADAVATRARAGADPPVEAVQALARHFIATERAEEAETLLAVEARDDAESLALLAQARLKLGRLTDAADTARRALAEEPTHDAAQRWLTAATGYQQVIAEGWLPALPGAPATLETTPGRVLHLLLRSLPHYQSGYTVRSASIVAAQRAAGLDPVVVTQIGFPAEVGVDDAPATEEVAGVTHHRLADSEEPAHGLDARLEQYARAAAGVVEQVRPAVLHPASNFKNGFVALALGARYGLPVVYEVRGFQEDSWASRIGGEGAAADSYHGRQSVERRVMAGADHVVTLAEVMRDEIAATSDIAAEKITVVPNAVDAEVFHPVARDPALAASWDIDEHEVTIGYISTFAPFEGIVTLVEAIARLVRAGYDVKGVLVGDDARNTPGVRAALARRAGELGINDHVVFTGRVPHDEILRYYGLIDIFVVPRTDERVCHLVTPLKPLEALATARCVAVSRVRALAEIIHDGETGLAFTPEDPADLARAIEPAVADPGLRASLGAAGREWVASERTWTRNAERYRAIYEQVGAL